MRYSDRQHVRIHCTRCRRLPTGCDLHDIHGPELRPHARAVDGCKVSRHQGILHMLLTSANVLAQSSEDLPKIYLSIYPGIYLNLILVLLVDESAPFFMLCSA